MNKDILKTSFTVNDENVTMELSDDMVINVADITESYVDQPAKYAYWATFAALLRSKANKLKQQVDRETDYIKTTLTGSLDSKVRIQLELDGEKITESKVSSAIFTHPEYIAHKDKLKTLQEEYLEADEKARLLEVGKETMNQRKEMLISLGAQLRTDYDGTSDFHIKSKQESVVNLETAKEIVGKGKRSRTTRKPIITESEE